MRPPTVRQLVWYVMWHPEKLTEGEQRAVAGLRAVHPDLEQAVQFTREFTAMIQHRQADQLEPWLWRVANSDVPALSSFAAGIRRDKTAVLAGLSLGWSQGQVEDQIRRFRLLKCSAYRCASAPCRITAIDCTKREGEPMIAHSLLVKLIPYVGSLV